MARSDAKTVAAYLKELPADRRKVIAAVRKVIKDKLPKGYDESMNWGMICYEVPLSAFPDTYNGQPLMYAALAAQKNYFAVYLTCAYQDAASAKELKKAFTDAGKKLDMGKSCIRFKKLDDLPLDVIGRYVAAVTPEVFIKQYAKARRK